jgi:hypothetical protein
MAGKGSSHMDFIQSLKASTPPPTGVYVGAVIGEPRPINDERRRGARFTIEITEGPMQGRRVPIELIAELKVGGNRARLLSDHQALAAWITALGVESAETPTELIAKLRDAAVGKRVEFELECNRWKNFINIYLIGVRLAP